MSASLHLQSIFHWPAQDTMPLAELVTIDTKQRRRLSSLAKLSLVARQALTHEADLTPTDHILWCSSYGDEHKTLSIMQDIANGEIPSPTAFATSVHNATAGLYSMLYQDDVASTSMNIGQTELCNALLYAHALLQTNAAHQVLLVCADEPLPEIYHNSDLLQAYAMACVFKKVDAHHAPNLHIHCVDNHIQTDTNHPQARQFAEFWQSNEASLQLDTWQLCKS